MATLASCDCCQHALRFLANALHTSFPTCVASWAWCGCLLYGGQLCRRLSVHVAQRTQELVLVVLVAAILTGKTHLPALCIYRNFYKQLELYVKCSMFVFSYHRKVLFVSYCYRCFQPNPPFEYGARALPKNNN